MMETETVYMVEYKAFQKPEVMAYDTLEEARTFARIVKGWEHCSEVKLVEITRVMEYHRVQLPIGTATKIGI